MKHAVTFVSSIRVEVPFPSKTTPAMHETMKAWVLLKLELPARLRWTVAA